MDIWPMQHLVVYAKFGTAQVQYKNWQFSGLRTAVGESPANNS